MPQFEDVAGHFADELRSYGLEPVSLDLEETTADGVWAKVANWPGNRPFISIWFDKFLAGVPHFWFGFESDQERIIKQLVDEASRFDEFKRPVKITNNDLNDEAPWRLLKAKVTELKENGGLAHDNIAVRLTALESMTWNLTRHPLRTSQRTRQDLLEG
jgi:hypothetical protein